MSGGVPPITLREIADIPVERLKGVGDKKQASLAGVGIHTVLDLVTTYPRRWVDRTNEARIADLVPGEEALVLVTVRSGEAAPDPVVALWKDGPAERIEVGVLGDPAIVWRSLISSRFQLYVRVTAPPINSSSTCAYPVGFSSATRKFVVVPAMVSPTRLPSPS